ncbi:hypothetical protein NQ318_004277 [Aromia moschata]|uniref:Tetratricopeptide repeat protein 21B n=1 Tax=Aromia moschata TaxID=1265417 RepID=A0AAV8XQN9_9CUCU|nr:hypothetical protein NQ318_004277 [Aromia moschata]
MQSSLSECLTLKGWILLRLRTSGKRSVGNIKDAFDAALQQNPRNLNAIIGFTECCLLQQDFAEALSAINKAVVRYPSTNLPLLQKLRVLLAQQDWDQAVETVNRIGSTEPKNLYAKNVFLIILMCRSAAYEEAVAEVKKYIQLVESLEPGNVHLVLDTAGCLIKSTSRMLEVAVQTYSDNAELVVELGYLALLRGKTKEALRCFKSATKIDETSLDALLGLSLCELKENGSTDQLKNQVQFLLELKGAQDSLSLHYIRAKISDTSDEALRHLRTICDVKLSQVKSIPYSDIYLLSLDPDFMLDVVKEYMQHVSLSKSAPDSIYEVLTVLVKACPGLSEALFLLAKLQYIKGDNTSSMNSLEKLLSNVANPQSEAQLLMAQIQTQHRLFERAAQTLEACVSSNFKVRENPIYHYITALVDKNTSNYADAIKSLTTALSLVNIKSNHGKQMDVSLVERASMYVELIDTLNVVGQTEEAAKILENATGELRGTPEEARILLLSAEHSLRRKNVQGAIDLLGRIKPTDLCYVEAKAKRAEVLLQYRKDKYAYLECYEDFVRENPGPESYVMLGDAYMKVLEPDDALECYEKALKENPKDPLLTSKMGKALVETHYFQRAVNYYKEVIKTTNDSELKLQLAELYMNLRQYDKGELILLNELEDENPNMAEDLTYLQHKTRLLTLLSQIQEKSGNITYALKSLKDAMDNQHRVRKRMTVEQNGRVLAYKRFLLTMGFSDVPESEIKTLIDISLKLGEMAMSQKNNEQAVNYYKEGLEVSPHSTSLMVALAKLYMQMNYLELCQQTCANILRKDPENETASVMMADIAFRKIDFDMALFHFTQLVTKQPTNWEALIRLIEILRRTGNIADCPSTSLLRRRRARTLPRRRASCTAPHSINGTRAT